MKCPWRLVLNGATDAFLNMAVDEAVLGHCIQGKSRPTLRLYEWEKFAISFGYALDAEAELDLPLCREKDVPVVRRITGGGVVFHKCDITYAVVFPDDFGLEEGRASGKQLSVLESYRLVNGALAEGLKELGVSPSLLRREDGGSGGSQKGRNVCFSNPTVYDILHNGRKLAGGAQRRKKGWILHHGSMLFSSDFVEMCPLIRQSEGRQTSSGRCSPGSAASATHPMARAAVCLEEILGERPEREHVVQVLSDRFARALGICLERSPLTASELEMAERLRKEKYATEDWNLRRAVPKAARLSE